MQFQIQILLLLLSTVILGCTPEIPGSEAAPPDYDGDGIIDSRDVDDDDDGCLDAYDLFPFDPLECQDRDSDGIGDNSDPDIDNDGVLNEDDRFPYDSTESSDMDFDGIGDNTDLDNDNDHFNDDVDAFPFNRYEHKDTDGDGIGDNSDPDIDGDGVENEFDSKSSNSAVWAWNHFSLSESIPDSIITGGNQFRGFGRSVSTMQGVDYTTVAISASSGTEAAVYFLKLNKRIGLNQYFFDFPYPFLVDYDFLTSSASYDSLGHSIAVLGDVNGDENIDFLVGAPKTNEFNVNVTNGEGAAYLVFGGGDAESHHIEDYSLKLTGFPMSGLGAEVAGQFDFNGDGIFDFAITAPNYVNDSSQRVGAVFVLFGRAEGWPDDFSLSDLDGKNGFKIEGFGSGIGLAGINDLNNDGYDEFFIGDYLFDHENAENVGRSFLIFGTPDDVSAEQNITSWTESKILDWTGKENDEQLGYKAVGLGNFNGDEYNDLAITNLSPTDSNAVYVLFGGEYDALKALDINSLSTDQGFKISGRFYSNHILGSRISKAADFNGDGLSDLVIGAYNPKNFSTGSGLVVFGSEIPSDIDNTNFDESKGFTFSDAGSWVSIDGNSDIDGDGLSDIVLGSSNKSYQTGETFFIYGCNKAIPCDSSAWKNLE